MNRDVSIPVNPEPFPGITIELSDSQPHVQVDHDALTQLATATLLAEGVQSASVSIALVDDATIRPINRDHLGHDWPTDVISFGFSRPGDLTLTGELVISAEMAATTARRAGVDPWDELALYVVHGLLHLCGHDDTEPDVRSKMRRREAELLAAAGRMNTFDLADAPEACEDATGPRSEAALWTS
jgi:probable rRNA maturation factor